MKKNIQFLMRSSLLVMVVLLLSTCATNPVTGKKDFVMMTEAQEIQMGTEYDPQIVAMYGLYDDAKIQQFIETKGQQMARISHRSHLNFDFKVMDSPVVNAFAVPGGYVYFTRGILAHFNNEAEFAGVLGHEIGHVSARHSVKQMSKAQIAQIGLVAGMAISPKFQQFAGIAQGGMQLLFLKNGRDDESQSDALGVEYSTRIGYDANYMAGFFKTLGRLSEGAGSSIPSFLSTHPDPADRYTNVGKLTQEWQSKVQGPFNVNRDGYLRMIDGLVYGEDPRQGYTEKDVFYHPEMLFQFPIPSGWKVANSPTQVQIASPDGKGFIIFTLAEGTDLNAAAQTAITNYKLTSKSQNTTKVNGFDAIVLEADQIDAQDATKSVSLLSYFIKYGQKIYVFHGVSGVADFANYTAQFSSTMKGFNKLTDKTKINVKPERIQIKTVPKTATVQQTFQTLGVPTDRMTEMSILNGMELTEQVEKGMLIKVVGK